MSEASFNTWGRAATRRATPWPFHLNGKKMINTCCVRRGICCPLVNCHYFTGRILDRWISRQTGMKSPSKWHNQPGKKNRGLLGSLTVAHPFAKLLVSQTRTGVFVFAVSLCLGIGPGRTVFVTFKSIFTF